MIKLGEGEGTPLRHLRILGNEEVGKFAGVGTEEMNKIRAAFMKPLFSFFSQFNHF